MNDYRQLLDEVVTARATVTSLLVDIRATRLWLSQAQVPYLLHQSVARFAQDVDCLDDLDSRLGWDHAVLTMALPLYPRVSLLPVGRVKDIELRIELARDVMWWFQDYLDSAMSWGGKRHAPAPRMFH